MLIRRDAVASKHSVVRGRHGAHSRVSQVQPWFKFGEIRRAQFILIFYRWGREGGELLAGLEKKNQTLFLWLILS